jgi:hypothetical protein
MGVMCAGEKGEEKVEEVKKAQIEQRRPGARGLPSERR